MQCQWGNFSCPSNHHLSIVVTDNNTSPITSIDWVKGCINIQSVAILIGRLPPSFIGQTFRKRHIFKLGGSLIERSDSDPYQMTTYCAIYPRVLSDKNFPTDPKGSWPLLHTLPSLDGGRESIQYQRPKHHCIFLKNPRNDFLSKHT